MGFRGGASSIIPPRPSSYAMKKVFYILLATLLTACSSSDDDYASIIPVMTPVIEQPEIAPYSCDITSKGIEVVYTVKGATKVNVLYKEQLDENWTTAESITNGQKMTVRLTNLQQNHYYYIFATALNEAGQSATDNFMVKYDYNSARDTYYTQPFLQWGTNISNVKTALADKGSVLTSETVDNGETHLVYRFVYKELWSEYIFDSENHLKEVLVCFDKNRVMAEELRKYIGLAFGYLATGNIHISVGGVETVGTLFKTAEGTSYSFVYETNEHVIVDYVSTSGIDITETQYK